MPRLVFPGAVACYFGDLLVLANVGGQLAGALTETDRRHLATTVHAIAGELQLEIYCIPLASNG